MGELYALVAVFEVGIGAFFNLAGDFGFCGAAVGRIVLEAAVVRRIVGRGDDDAVGADAARVAADS